LIVVILDGALPSTVIGTLSYAEATGQKVNCGPLASGRKFKFGFGPEGGKEEGKPVNYYVRSHSHDSSFMHSGVSLFYSYTVVAETHFVIVTVPLVSLFMP
jgi:hypothetical protein